MKLKSIIMCSTVLMSLFLDWNKYLNQRFWQNKNDKNDNKKKENEKEEHLRIANNKALFFLSLSTQVTHNDY